MKTDINVCGLKFEKSMSPNRIVRSRHAFLFANKYISISKEFAKKINDLAEKNATE